MDQWQARVSHAHHHKVTIAAYYLSINYYSLAAPTEDSNDLDDAIDVLTCNLKDKSVKLLESLQKFDPTNSGKVM